MMDRWYDVQDQDGVWRVSECYFEDKVGTRTMAFDGFHPNHTTIFCKHSSKVQPIRTKTFGLTVPEDRRPLRQVLTQLELENISGRIKLYLMKPNYLQFQPKLIKTSIRTEFLILVDKIMTTPFEIIRQIKRMDPQISNFFINVLSLYTRVIEFCKTFLTMLDTNQTAQQLYKSIYQLTLMANLIFGLHPHSANLYNHKLNINIKSQGFIDFFVMSDSGLLPFRNFFKGMGNIKKPNDFDYEVSTLVANLVLDLCEKSKGYLVDGACQSKTVLVLDEIINSLKQLCEQNDNVRTKINNNPLLISKIESLYFKVRSNKICPLRKYISKQEHKQQKQKNNQMQIQLPLSMQKSIYMNNQDVWKLEERVKKLEIILGEKEKRSGGAGGGAGGGGGAGSSYAAGEELRDGGKFQRPSLPVENLGEEMFLGSIEWALENGDVETAKKMVKWRKSLLQVGRITGWQVALAIGARTYKKQEITAADIIQANYEHISKLRKQ